MSKKWIRCMGCMVAFLLMLTGCGSQQAAVPAVPKTLLGEEAVLPLSSERQDFTVLTGWKSVAETACMTLFVEETTGNVAVADGRTGTVYYSSVPDAEKDAIAGNGEQKKMQSPLLLSVLGEESQVERTISSYAGAYENGRIQVKKTETGALIWYVFDEEKFAVPVEYSLCEDGFRARVRCDQIQEKGIARIYGLSLLPYVFAQPGDGDGFMLVPDGSGALMYFRSNKTTYGKYVAPLYGEDALVSKDYSPTVTEDLMLPMIGMQARKGGFLAVAEQGAALGSVNAIPNGVDNTYNSIYFSFSLRNRQTTTIGATDSFYSTVVTVDEQGPIAVGDISVRYVLLDSTPDNGLSRMAQVGRALANAGVEENTPHPAPTMYLSVLGGYQTTLSLAGIRLDTVQKVTPVREMQEILQRLTAKGVNDVAVVYHGYDTQQLQGKITDSLHFSSAVGNRRDWEALADQVGEGRLFLTYDPMLYTKGSGTASIRTDSVADLSLNKCAVTTYKRSTLFPDSEADTRYLLKIPHSIQVVQQVGEQLRSKLPGVSLLIAQWGNRLYGDYAEKGTRRQEAQALLGEAVRQLIEKQAVGLSAPQYYAARWVGTLMDVPAESSRFLVLDEDVPFYQMVMGGKRTLVSRPLNLYGSPSEQLLHVIRCGMVPQFEVAGSGVTFVQGSGLAGFYGASVDRREQEMVEAYQLVEPLLERIAGHYITSYRTQQTGVYEIEYDTGVQVLVNMSEQAYVWNGQTVKPHGFAYQ